MTDKTIPHYKMPNDTPLYVMDEHGDILKLTFHRMDGMYSCCTITDDKGETKFAHFSGAMPVEPYEDGYRCPW